MLTSKNPPSHESSETEELSSKKSAWRDLLSVAGVVAGALSLAFVLITFVFQSYLVDGPSMQSTLQTGDHLFVWKVPATIARLTHKVYIPHRGDVIVFNESGSGCGSAGKKQLIKRVVGLPGEHVVFKGTSVTVYNKEHPGGFNPDATLPYGDKLINHNESDADVVVGENQLFVSGDNRDNSCDSRAFGPISTNDIVGKLTVRILPLNSFKLF